MAQLKVIVPRLNKRKGPVTDFNDKGNVIAVLKEGESFESVVQITNALGTWHGNREGHWAWQEGFVVPPPGQLKWQFDKTRMSWAHDSVAKGGLGIVDLWNEMGVRGEGIGVVVLDTGITSKLADFTRNGISIIKGVDFVKNVDLVDAIDFDGHGTNSAGILSATGVSQVYGVAPDVDLYIIRFTGNRTPEFASLKKGLELLNTRNWDFNIVSISFSFSEADKELEDLISALSKKSIVLSALNHPVSPNDKIDLNDGQFPAIYDKVIPVTAVKKNLTGILPPCQLVSAKSIWGFPGEDILTLDKKGSPDSTAFQTSIATPFGGGVFALFLSFMKANHIPLSIENLDAVKALLLEGSKREAVDSVPGQTVNICQPLKTFDLFKKHFNL